MNVCDKAAGGWWWCMCRYIHACTHTLSLSLLSYIHTSALMGACSGLGGKLASVTRFSVCPWACPWLGTGTRRSSTGTCTGTGLGLGLGFGMMSLFSSSFLLCCCCWWWLRQSCFPPVLYMHVAKGEKSEGVAGPYMYWMEAGGVLLQSIYMVLLAKRKRKSERRMFGGGRENVFSSSLPIARGQLLLGLCHHAQDREDSTADEVNVPALVYVYRHGKGVV